MGIKISDLPAASSLDGTEIVPIVQSGVTKKSLLSLLRTWLFTNPIALGSGTPAAITGTTITASSQFSGPGTGLTGTSAMNITGWAKSDGAGADIASAATVNFTTRTGNIVRITGTTTTTAVTLANGDTVTAIAVAAWPINISGVLTYTCVAGSTITFTQDSNGTQKAIVQNPDLKQSLATNGYTILAGGVTLQWGTFASSGTGNPNVTVNFPSTFASVCAHATIQILNGAGYFPMVITKSTTGLSAVTLNASGVSTTGVVGTWFAIGY